MAQPDKYSGEVSSGGGPARNWPGFLRVNGWSWRQWGNSGGRNREGVRRQRPGFSTGEGVRITFEYGHRNALGEAIQFRVSSQLGYLPNALILEQAVRRKYDELDVGQRLERRNTATVEFPEIGLGPLFRLAVDGVDVRDNGPGIPREEHDLIFERFRQGGDALTGNPGGSGLGLYISRRIVEHFGGRIWVTSQRGEGACFSFTLPCAGEATLEAA